MKGIRWIILKVLQKECPFYYGGLFPRASVFEIGFEGNGPTDIDREIAQDKKLKKLNFWEKWLLKNEITFEKERRRKSDFHKRKRSRL